MAYGAIAALVVSAVGAVVKGQSQSKMLDYQAGIQENNAAESIASAKVNANRQTIISNKQIGGISADYAASGVDSHSGSVLAVLGASAANAEMDRQNVIHGGTIRAVNYENQASLDRSSAGNALTGSYYAAAGHVVSGAMSLYGNTMGGGSDLLDDGSGGSGGGMFNSGGYDQSGAYARQYPTASASLLDGDQ